MAQDKVGREVIGLLASAIPAPVRAIANLVDTDDTSKVEWIGGHNYQPIPGFIRATRITLYCSHCGDVMTKRIPAAR